MAEELGTVHSAEDDLKAVLVATEIVVLTERLAAQTWMEMGLHEIWWDTTANKHSSLLFDGKVFIRLESNRFYISPILTVFAQKIQVPYEYPTKCRSSDPKESCWVYVEKGFKLLKVEGCQIQRKLRTGWIAWISLERYDIGFSNNLIRDLNDRPIRWDKLWKIQTEQTSPHCVYSLSIFKELFKQTTSMKNIPYVCVKSKENSV